MDRELAAFLRGESNVTRLDALLSRETTSDGRQRISIKEFGQQTELYTVWIASSKPRSKSPKHTGGKKPYLMLMVDEVERLRTKGVKDVGELIGYLVTLGKHIEWSTGRLVKGRGKRKTPMRYADLQAMYGCSNKKLNKMLADMKAHDLLSHTEGGYFVSRRLVKRGKQEGARDA